MTDLTAEARRLSKIKSDADVVDIVFATVRGPAIAQAYLDAVAEIDRLRDCVERACNSIEHLELGRRDAILRLRAALPSPGEK